MHENEKSINPRIIVIQKLYAYRLNKDSTIYFPKHRYKKFIKDVVNGTIERQELIENLINDQLKQDMNENKTDLIVKLMITAAMFELLYMHKIPIKVVITEYLKISDYFIGDSQKKFF